jgi:predicted NUDIX family phosphoesterase
VIAVPESERVLCVPTAEFHRLGVFQGFSADADRYLDALLVPGVAVLRPRSEVEDDPAWKQIIPYQVLAWRGYVFCYRRGGKGGEARLHGGESLGIGGHVNEADFEAARRACRNGFGGIGTVLTLERTAVLLGSYRELDEEIDGVWVYDRQIVGLINDDSNPVGAVHLGVAIRLDCEEPCAQPKDGTMEAAVFRPWREAVARREAMESWSGIIVDHLPSLLGQGPPAVASGRR